MCELLGFSAEKKMNIQEYLRVFFSHSIINPHGWGLMYEDNTRRIVREPVRAADSSLLRDLYRLIPAQNTALAHIRFATVGSVTMENCHPFTGEDISGREWTMIHNGTIYSGGVTCRYQNKQAGDTDSERLFLAFLDRMNDRLSKCRLNERERFQTVSGFISENAPRNKLNLMLYDGELLYIHKNMKNYRQQQ